MLKRSKWSLIEIPDDRGVFHVGGRIGAAQGPKAFQIAFSRLKGAEKVHETLMVTNHVEALSSDVEKNHVLAAQRVQESHTQTGLSVVIGGGHDHGYSHLLGISQVFHQLGCINIDAHLDVRKPEPFITSGSPFYLALERAVLDPENLIEFGIQTHCNGPELWEYVRQKKVEVIPFERLRRGRAVPVFKKKLKELASVSDAIVISLDLDAIACAFAPGVSAPQAEGFNPSDILEMMEIAGQEQKVVSLGIFELNPVHDTDNRTALLGATAVYHFIQSSLRTHLPH